MTLTDSDRERLRDDGFLVLRNVFSEAECEALCSAISVFVATTAARTRAAGRISPFWEAFATSDRSTEVFWDTTQSGLLERRPEQWEPAVMRIGHALHRLPPFDEFIRDRRIVSALTTAIGEPAEIAQSSIIYKQPHSDAVQFGWHQDSSYLPNEPESLVLAFVALDAMTEQNGALEVLPRSHSSGLHVVYRLGPAGLTPVGRDAESVRGRGELLELTRGSVVLVHGRTYHASKPNRSPGPRRALIVHAKAASSRMTEDSWSRGPFDPLTPVR